MATQYAPKAKAVTSTGGSGTSVIVQTDSYRGYTWGGGKWDLPPPPPESPQLNYYHNVKDDKSDNVSTFQLPAFSSPNTKATTKIFNLF